MRSSLVFATFLPRDTRPLHPEDARNVRRRSTAATLVVRSRHELSIQTWSAWVAFVPLSTLIRLSKRPTARLYFVASELKK